jgi:hypothetical protein
MNLVSLTTLSDTQGVLDDAPLFTLLVRSNLLIARLTWGSKDVS